MNRTSLLCRTMCGAIFGVLAVAPAQAAVFNVSTTADSGLGSLRRALNEANKTPEQDRIIFNLPLSQLENGRWTIELQSLLPVIETPMRIVGPGSKLLTVRGNTQDRSIFSLSGPVLEPGSTLEAPSSYIAGITLRDANSATAAVSAFRVKAEFKDIRFLNNRGTQVALQGLPGGAVTSNDSVLSFQDCVFADNSAYSAAAVNIYGNFASTFTNCVFRNNKATGVGDPFGGNTAAWGGAIYSQGDLTLQSCTFERNEGYLGSAVCLDPLSPLLPEPRSQPATVTINRCTFSFNKSNVGEAEDFSSSGALYNAGANVSITNTFFHGNSMLLGGAIYNKFGNLQIRRSSFLSNSAKTGSAVLTEIGNTLLFNSTLANNLARDGAVIEHSLERLGEPKTLIANCTFYRNNQTQQAVFDAGLGQISFINTIVDEPGTRFSKDGGKIVSMGHNLMNAGSGLPETRSSDILNQDPLFHPIGVDNYGGPTPTIGLYLNSPCIDAGNNVVLGAPYNFSVDQRGFMRKDGVRVDIGAFEVKKVPTLKRGPSGNAF